MSGHDLDALLQHAGWLDRLGRQLARDDTQAADAVQDTLLAASRRPPRHEGNLRAFLATILRNVLRLHARREERQRRREHAVASHAISPHAESASDTVARAEQHQRLGALVLALPEPQRSLVLRHYFDGDGVEMLAVQYHISQDAVHGHLRRARDALRLRLHERATQRPRRTAVLPFAFPSSFAALLTMSVHSKLVVAGLVLALGTLCVWALQPKQPTLPTPTATAERSVATASSPLAPPPQLERVAATPPAAPTTPTAPSITPDATGSLTGRVVDAKGQPVHPASVFALRMVGDQPAEKPTQQADVDELGRFAFVSTLDDDVLLIAIPLRTEPGSTRLLPHDQLTATSQRAEMRRAEARSAGDLVAPAAAAIRGTVRMPAGIRRAGIRIGFWPVDETWSTQLGSFSVARASSGGLYTSPLRSGFGDGVVTDADGAFAIAAAPGLTGYVYLLNDAAGEMQRLVHERTATAPGVVDFDLLAPACIQVRQDGKPVPEVLASLELPRSDGKATDENYRADDAGEIRVLREREATLRGKIRRPGRAPLTFDVPPDATPANPLVVDLGTVTTTPVQLVLTSDREIHALNATLARLDEDAGSIQLAADGAPLRNLQGEAPAGRYRLQITPAVWTGDDAFVLWQTHEVTIGAEPVAIPVHLEFGGRIEVEVVNAGEAFAGGSIRLVDAAGKQSAPTMREPGRGNGRRGELRTAGPLQTAQPLAPGRYEVIIDLRERGVHHQFADVRAGEVARVRIPLP